MYGNLDPLLNPKGPPSKFDLFLLKAAVQVAKHGMSKLKSAIAGGQYTHPQGLFYGGSSPSVSMQILGAHLPRLLAGATDIIHIDLHTGLGKWGHYVLATSSDMGPEKLQWLGKQFGEEVVQNLDPNGVLYEIRGELGLFCRSLATKARSDRTYIPLLAEFGTLPILKVMAALRYENRVWNWTKPKSAARKRARGLMMDAFAPPALFWRHMVVERALGIADQALEGLEVL